MPIYEFNGKRPLISASAFVHPTAVIIGDAVIGDEVFLAPGAVIRADFGPILIGARSSIQDNAVVHVSPRDRVIIAEDVIIAHHVVLHDVTIHDRCLVGMGAVLLQKVVCEEDVFIAAGAVVSQGMYIPAGKLVAGSPARLIRDITSEMKKRIAKGVDQYVRLGRLYRETMKSLDPASMKSPDADTLPGSR